MTAPSSASQPPRPEAAAPSERVLLARLALDAALGVPGVVSADAGRFGTRVTADREERFSGVLVTALAVVVAAAVVPAFVVVPALVVVVPEVVVPARVPVAPAVDVACAEAVVGGL